MVIGLILLLFAAILVFYSVRRVCGFVDDHCHPIVYQRDVDLAGKTVIVTGSNSGIGKATAMDLASRGARVILACRNMSKAEMAVKEIIRKTSNRNVLAMHLDLSDFVSVRSFANLVNHKETRLDILINNAGMAFTPIENNTQGFDYIFTINHFGHFLLTYLLLDLLKISSPSRIVNISSMGHHNVLKPLDFNPKPINNKKYPGLSGYMRSKLANILHVLELSGQLKGTNVTANAVNPGLVQTDIWNNTTEKTSDKIIIGAFGFLVKNYGRSAAQGADTVVYAAVDPDLANISGQYLENMKIANNSLSDLARDHVMAKRLWQISMDVCGLR